MINISEIKINTLIYQWKTKNSTKKYEILDISKTHIYIYNNEVFKISFEDIQSFFVDDWNLAISKNIEYNFFEVSTRILNMEVLNDKIKFDLMKKIKILNKKHKRK